MSIGETSTGIKYEKSLEICRLYATHSNALGDSGTNQKEYVACYQLQLGD